MQLVTLIMICAEDEMIQNNWISGWKYSFVCHEDVLVISLIYMFFSVSIQSILNSYFEPLFTSKTTFLYDMNRWTQCRNTLIAKSRNIIKTQNEFLGVELLTILLLLHWYGAHMNFYQLAHKEIEKNVCIQWDRYGNDGNDFARHQLNKQLEFMWAVLVCYLCFKQLAFIICQVGRAV